MTQANAEGSLTVSCIAHQCNFIIMAALHHKHLPDHRDPGHLECFLDQQWQTSSSSMVVPTLEDSSRPLVTSRIVLTQEKQTCYAQA